MASTYFDAAVYGLADLRANLLSLASGAQMERVIKTALQAGGRVVAAGARDNARAFGFGKQGIAKDVNGRTYVRHGRIPRSFTTGRGYRPRRDSLNRIVVKVVASRSRKRPFNARAPHAHLLEYGFNRRGRRYPAHPMLSRALADKTADAIRKISESMEAGINKYKFPRPVTGRRVP